MNLTAIPPHAEKALRLLETGGFEAWCVGGCVRDLLLGLAPHDWDVTTNALPSEIKSCFPGCKTVDTGLRHGTVTVLLDGEPVEITTYRSDGAYTDHRHPEAVRFSKSLADDLSRRDFTVNALAFHPARGLRDLFGGLTDLENRRLRCVGDPLLRFEEDALRILRCLRFASVLGFSVDPGTAHALREQQALLGAVSHERVREELSRLLRGQNAGAVLREFSGTVFTVLPELAPMADCAQENPYHCYDVWEHTLHALEAVPPEEPLRWAALLHDCGKPAAKFYGPDGTAHFYCHEKESAAIAREILTRLRFSNRETEEILDLVRFHGEVHPVSEKRLKKLLGKLGEEQVFRLFALSRADLTAQAPHLYEKRIASIEESETLTREILSREECLTLRDLEIKGGDLLALGFPEGPALGKALHTLLDGVLEGSLPNEREALLQRAAILLRSS